MMIRLRSLLYLAGFYPWTILIGSSLPFLLLFPLPLTLKASRLWTRGVFWLLRVCCGIRYEVRGREHLPTDGPALIASKHQSAWETLVFLLLLPNPAYVLKRELLWLPFFGQFVWRLDMIAIKREDGRQALKQLIAAGKRITAQGRSIVLFPEGTRKAPGAAPDYKKGGITSLYQALPEVPLIPAALNSGLYWGRNQWIKQPGTIILEILPPLPAGLSSREMMERLETAIESHSNALLAKP